jgi:hypothetical protein
MGPASAPQAPGICEEKAQLECRYREAEDAFNSARTAIRQMVGRSAKDEYLALADALDLAWERLQHAWRGLATHLREHGCGIIQEDPSSFRSIW